MVIYRIDTRLCKKALLKEYLKSPSRLCLAGPIDIKPHNNKYNHVYVWSSCPIYYVKPSAHYMQLSLACMITRQMFMEGALNNIIMKPFAQSCINPTSFN